MRYRTLHELPLKGKRVLIRTDFNVPLNDQGQIADDSRIEAALPTIRFILESGASAILISHLGRPDGKRKEELSLEPIAKHLATLLKKEVLFAPDCVGESVEKMASRLSPGQVLVLENLRFHPGEEDPDKEPGFVEKLSRIGDIYINDAFATSHRKHASTYYIVEHYENSAIGFLVEKEVLILTNLLTQANSPFYAIIGGSKIASKIGVLESLLDKVDGLLIGGAMAFTFLAAMGKKIGNSMIDESHFETAKQIIKRCKGRGIDFQLPLDVVIAQSLSSDADHQIIDMESGIPDGWMGVDIGPKTIAHWREILKEAKTIFWNGPVGVFEVPAFQKGTHDVAQILSQSRAMTIIGGGDSAAAIYQLGFEAKITCISTGGGATLEFIELGTLPALEPFIKEE